MKRLWGWACIVSMMLSSSGGAWADAGHAVTMSCSGNVCELPQDPQSPWKKRSTSQISEQKTQDGIVLANKHLTSPKTEDADPEASLSVKELQTPSGKTQGNYTHLVTPGSFEQAKADWENKMSDLRNELEQEQAKRAVAHKKQENELNSVDGLPLEGIVPENRDVEESEVSENLESPAIFLAEQLKQPLAEYNKQRAEDEYDNGWGSDFDSDNEEESDEWESDSGDESLDKKKVVPLNIEDQADHSENAETQYEESLYDAEKGEYYVERPLGRLYFNESKKQWDDYAMDSETGLYITEQNGKRFLWQEGQWVEQHTKEQPVFLPPPAPPLPKENIKENGKNGENGSVKTGDTRSELMQSIREGIVLKPISPKTAQAPQANQRKDDLEEVSNSQSSESVGSDSNKSTKLEGPWEKINRMIINSESQDDTQENDGGQANKEDDEWDTEVKPHDIPAVFSEYLNFNLEKNTSQNRSQSSKSKKNNFNQKKNIAQSHEKDEKEKQTRESCEKEAPRSVHELVNLFGGTTNKKISCQENPEITIIPNPSLQPSSEDFLSSNEHMNTKEPEGIPIVTGDGEDGAEEENENLEQEELNDQEGVEWDTEQKNREFYYEKGVDEGLEFAHEIDGRCEVVEYTDSSERRSREHDSSSWIGTYGQDTWAVDLNERFETNDSENLSFNDLSAPGLSDEVVGNFGEDFTRLEEWASAP